MENDNKKTLILSVVGILVLVIAVVGVSFAMFSFSGTGTKENVIKTGTVSINFTDDTKNAAIELNNSYPESDAKGLADNTNKADFDIEAEWGSSSMTINYDVGINVVEEGTTLKSNYVKVALLDSEGAYIVGSESAGVTIASLANKAGDHNLIKNYALTSGTMTTSGDVDNYSIKAWVSDAYDLSIDNTQSTSPEVAGGTLDNQEGKLHQKTTAKETYKFKVYVTAAQA